VNFGISTHLYHHQRLDETHLADVAASGFGAIELFATRTHFDYGDPAAVARLARWLGTAGLRLHSVHAPITAGLVDGTWGPPLSLAATDGGRRRQALQEAGLALAIADQVPFEFLVVHLGVPDELRPGPGDNQADAARRSIEELHEVAARRGITLALEVIPNALSSVEALVRLIDSLDLDDAGICLDFGHAAIMGDVLDAIEEASGHLVTTHVHDNHGTRDEHLPPGEGSIDWSAALFAMQKIGYDGVFLFELADAGAPAEQLRRAQAACRRLEELYLS
jgi:sugar phosphate isomerase/epimerase